MRTLEGIKQEQSDVINEICDLNAKLKNLREEERLRVQHDFEEKYGLKRGDKIKLKKGCGYHFYDHVNIERGIVFVYCRFEKKDGTPSKVSTWALMDWFNGLEIVGHVELF